ncbi:phospholipase A2 inhibitor gamma subunit B-like isoform 1-T2 [Anomaloglossus baeobatrachus]|uniref:phospholipase A2 inhibitor gamma subunit B-like n=1 Tax=Anomaloglossus baeobatrachus TaxID=238106 RepID=UPI003F4F7481
MKNLVTLLYMISALVVSVFSYNCYSCSSRNSTTCNDTETECLGDRCMTAYQYVNLYEKKVNSIYNGCANESLCGAKGSGMVEHVKFKFFAHCCTGNLCNNQTYEPPEDDLTPNGLKCPYSFCIGTLKECKSDKEINCTGSMNQCLEYRATLRNPDGTIANYSAKGCTNSDACQYNFDSKIAFQEIHRALLKCW